MGGGRKALEQVEIWRWWQSLWKNLYVMFVTTEEVMCEPKIAYNHLSSLLTRDSISFTIFRLGDTDFCDIHEKNGFCTFFSCHSLLIPVIIFRKFEILPKSSDDSFRTHSGVYATFQLAPPRDESCASQNNRLILLPKNV